MELRLIGEAVDPHVVLEPDTNRIDFGHTYTGDTCIKKLLLKNTCTLGVRYRVRVQGRNGKSGKVTNFSKFWSVMKASCQNFNHVYIYNYTGPANYSGQPVFDCIPFQGRMEPGQLWLCTRSPLSFPLVSLQMVPQRWKSSSPQTTRVTTSQTIYTSTSMTQ